MDFTPADSALNQFAPLCGPLQRAISYAAERAAEFRDTEGIDDPARDFIAAHMVRAVTHRQLEIVREDIAPWLVGKAQPNNGSLQLHAEAADLRLLHSPGTGRFPAPGANKARRKFYQQATLDAFFGEDAPLPELPFSRYIGTWSVDPKTFEVEIQVFRPIGTFKYGGKCKSDLAFWLPDNEDDLYNLTHEPTDQGIDLDIPGEEEDGGDALRG